MQPAGGQLCARARFWVSLRVDGELSELEGALLDAHLGRCVDCAEFAAGAAVTTDWLRSAQLDRPAPFTVALPKSPRHAVAGVVAAAALLAAALAAGFVHGTGVPHGRTSALSPVSVVSTSETPDELRRLRRTSLLNQRPVPREFSVEQ